MLNKALRGRAIAIEIYLKVARERLTELVNDSKDESLNRVLKSFNEMLLDLDDICLQSIK